METLLLKELSIANKQLLKFEDLYLGATDPEKAEFLKERVKFWSDRLLSIQFNISSSTPAVE